MPVWCLPSRSESDRFVGLIEAIGAADHKAAAKNLRAFDPASEKNLSQEQVQRSTMKSKQLFREKCRGYGTGVDFGDVVRGLLELVRKHRVRIGAQYATLVINALCLDGMAGDLLPGYSVLDGARPLLSAHRWFVSRGIPVLGPFVFRGCACPWRREGRATRCQGARTVAGTARVDAGRDPDLRAAAHRRVGRPVEEAVACARFRDDESGPPGSRRVDATGIARSRVSMSREDEF